ncbi:cell division protein FtsQ/DivIB [Aliiglaciecola sp. LCG003]|uniref:cell division protein FtsQ/DivIB n=1 Tax=Aliiglaciecola sp. LCG003 TaxID=3053655 RepID=UPI0025728AC6|nr:cell division protein FtsQ/DivIB [Aliiglaciecola sp. LCG003]WJG08725.1 cell division protein FtsQ/DivIB [Aliiglaciecola sp. LCG003]
MESLADKTSMSSRYQISGIVFLSVVILSLVYAGWWLNHWLEDAQKSPLQRVIVTGNRVHIGEYVIEQRIRQQHPESFFELDVNQVHQEIEALPWVHQASVRKRWPNSLNIHVIEEIASARWNNDSLLNQYGETFLAQLDDESLPNLFGPGGSEQTALRGYRAMQTLLNGANLRIVELYLSERFAWNLRLNNGVKLNLGRSEFVDRLQRFVDVYPLLKQQDRQVDYVDLRYDTGLAVGWKDANSKKQES